MIALKKTEGSRRRGKRRLRIKVSYYYKALNGKRAVEKAWDATPCTYKSASKRKLSGITDSEKLG